MLAIKTHPRLAGTLLLRPLQLHEFGHTLGLDDLYDNRKRGIYYNGRYDGYLMSKQGTLQKVPSVDVKYLEQVYRHHGGRPH